MQSWSVQQATRPSPWWSLLANSLLGGRDNASFLARTLFQIIFREKTRLARGISHEDASLLGRLDVGLVVAPDAIADGDEGELVLVEDVAAVGGQLQEPFGEAVVVLLLLDGVVQGGVTKVLVAVGDEELFELLVEWGVVR